MLLFHRPHNYAMTEQNFNLQEISNSGQALADSNCRFIDYVEKTFDLSTDEATWFIAGIIHRQPQSIDSNPEAKAQYEALAQSLKACRQSRTTNEQN